MLNTWTMTFPGFHQCWPLTSWKSTLNGIKQILESVLTRMHSKAIKRPKVWCSRTCLQKWVLHSSRPLPSQWITESLAREPPTLFKSSLTHKRSTIRSTLITSFQSMSAQRLPTAHSNLTSVTTVFQKDSKLCAIAVKISRYHLNPNVRDTCIKHWDVLPPKSRKISAIFLEVLAIQRPHCKLTFIWGGTCLNLLKERMRKMKIRARSKSRLSLTRVAKAFIN